MKYDCFLAPGVREDQPGIYEWRIIELIDERLRFVAYVGKYTRNNRPKKQYTRHVSRLDGDRPYRKGKPKGFRCVHRELLRAHRARVRIELHILENAAATELNIREQAWIARRRGEGVKLLNGT